MIMEENMIVIRDPKTFYFLFDWPNYVDDNLKREIDFIIKSNESSTENKAKKKQKKSKLNSYCQHIGMKMVFMNTKNSKTNGSHKFVLSLFLTLKIRLKKFK